MFNKKYLASALTTAAVVAVSTLPAYAYVQPIWLEVNQSYYMPQQSAIKRVAVTNPKIADVKVINKHAINIVALASGSTSLTVWTVNGMRQEFTVSVSPVDSNLAAVIQKAIGLPNVKVEKVGDKILLRGTVMNQREKEMAAKIAAMYVAKSNGDNKREQTSSIGNTKTSGEEKNELELPNDDGEWSDPNVINLLELENPDQINVEAEIIEINSSDVKNIGIEYGASVNSPGIYTIGDGTKYGSSDTTTSGTSSGSQSSTNGSGHDNYNTRSKGSHWYSRNWLYTHFSDLNMRVHALVENGKARIISQPNITTMSGKNAGILIGGEIPYPVSDGNGGVSVEFKPFGVQLKLLRPEVDRDGNVTAKLFAGVSRIDWQNSVTSSGYNMPGIATRSAVTMVNIPSGMTMAIAGLMNSDDADSVNGVPLLSKIPVLGSLFKYHEKTRQKTELLILITPRVVNETTPTKMRKDMYEAYQDKRHEDQALYQVDLNHPEQVEKTAEQQEKNKQASAKKTGSKLSEQDGSLLGKYLNQSVLPATDSQAQE